MKETKNFILPLNSLNIDREKLHVDTDAFKSGRKPVSYQKYVLPVIQREKKRKRDRKLRWWKDNIISLLSLLFAFIAALPAIFEFIEYIQAMLK